MRLRGARTDSGSQILARASNIRRFVKDTADKGWVEIELKGPIGDDNLVIRRDFDASSDKSDFKINGEPVCGACLPHID